MHACISGFKKAGDSFSPFALNVSSMNECAAWSLMKITVIIYFLLGMKQEEEGVFYFIQLDEDIVGMCIIQIKGIIMLCRSR